MHHWKLPEKHCYIPSSLDPSKFGGASRKIYATLGLTEKAGQKMIRAAEAARERRRTLGQGTSVEDIHDTALLGDDEGPDRKMWFLAVSCG